MRQSALLQWWRVLAKRVIGFIARNLARSSSFAMKREAHADRLEQRLYSDPRYRRDRRPGHTNVSRPFRYHRLMARRQAGHFGPADLLVIVLIADAAQRGSAKNTSP
jgi:hypothetical protein